MPSNFKLVIKITLPLNSKRSGMPSRRRALLSDNHEMVRFLPESKAPFNKFRATSSSKMLSQSSNTKTQLLSEYLYRVWYKPMGVALPLTTSARSRLPASLSNRWPFRSLAQHQTICQLQEDPTQS
jgi:hypothetical protein